MLAAEERKDQPDPDPTELSPEELEAEESKGLIREESLDLFIQWRALGGLERGISLMEILEAPGWLIQDFIYLLGEFGKARRRQERLRGDQSKR